MTLERNHVLIAGTALLATAILPSVRILILGSLCGVFLVLYLLVTTSRPQSGHDASTDRPRRPAFGIASNWTQEKAALSLRATYAARERLYQRSQKVSERLSRLLALLLRDFVTSWYQNMSRRPLFQTEIDKAIRDAVGTISTRLEGLDLVEIAVSRVVPMFTAHMQEFYVAEHLVRGKNLTRNITESEELDLAIAGKYRDGGLHRAASLAFADTKLMQQAHVRKTIGRVLPLVLSDDMQGSPAVVTLVREIVACAVLTPVFVMLADPDTWNQLIENFGHALLRDRKSVRKLRAALDEHASASPADYKVVGGLRLRPNDNERHFERFIRSIRQITNLPEALRLKNEISSQITRAAGNLDQDQVYLRRLDAGRRALEQKISSLTKSTTNGNSQSLTAAAPPANAENNLTSRPASLKDVLRDASGLSHFMEFMDRRKKMKLVQFFIIIDGFRNPLEEDTDEVDFTLQEQMQSNESDRIDVAQIKQGYLDLPEISVSSASRVAVNAYVKAGRNADVRLYLHARRAILRTQTAVFEEMRDQHFGAFKRSDLYFRWLAVESKSPQKNTNGGIPDLQPRRSFDTSRSPSTNLIRSATGSQHAARTKEPELRRAVMSSTDLHISNKLQTSPEVSRRSIDGPSSRPLFDDDVEEDRMTRSVPSLTRTGSDAGSSFDNVNESARVVDAMQKELDDIMDEPEREALFSDVHDHAGQPEYSPQFSDGFAESIDERPNIASLGLVGQRPANDVFGSNLFADEEEKYLSDEKEDPEQDRPIEESIHEAAPGDLGLKEAIAALTADVQRLTNQEGIVDSLTKKAELTNNAAELRILRKSKQSLQREIHRKELQRQQYIIQESDNSLYGKAAVMIKSIMVSKDEDGHEYAIYVIEVRRQAGDQMSAATWTVARRYSEFHELNKRLRARYDAVRNLEFPRRQTIFTLQRDFLQRRRTVLEKYLRALLQIPAICRSRELRAFLSQSAISNGAIGGTKVDQGDFVTRIYNSVSDGMEEFLGNVPVLDQLTVAGQNLITAASAQMNSGPGDLIDPGFSSDPTTAAEAEAEINAFEDREAEPFVKPISDLFLETFELQKGNSWLRGRAVVVVLHQLLGGTVERKVREAAKTFTEETSLLRYLTMAEETMWPDGKIRGPSVPRTAAQKASSRKEANLLLATLIPDMAASVVGKANAQAASRKIAALLNNHRLNTHLVLTLFDEIVHIVFPELQGNQ